MLRVDPSQPWTPLALLQPVSTLVLGLFFQWGVAAHDVDMPKYLFRPSQRTDEDRQKVRELVAKAKKQLRKDYLLFPLLAGPFALAVLSGNLVANVVRNVWSFLVIFCGHFPEGTETFPPEVLEGETRGGFYLRQLRGSANFEGSWALHVASGHLSHQIEHHMFPDVPAHRYPEMAVEVRAICKKYGVAYNSTSLGSQVWSVAKKIVRLALPSSGQHETAPHAA
jgi:fatty acid desaturase